MAIQVNGVAVPASMLARGIYRFQPAPIVRTNGRGEAITAGYPSVTWEFPLLTIAEFNYWNTTLLAGAPSLLCTNTRLYNQVGTETLYNSAILLRPQYERFYGAFFRSVVITVTQLVT